MNSMRPLKRLNKVNKLYEEWLDSRLPSDNEEYVVKSVIQFMLKNAINR